MKHYETPNAVLIVLSAENILTITVSGEGDVNNIRAEQYSRFFPTVPNA